MTTEFAPIFYRLFLKMLHVLKSAGLSQCEREIPSNILNIMILNVALNSGNITTGYRR